MTPTDEQETDAGHACIECGDPCDCGEADDSYCQNCTDCQRHQQDADEHESNEPELDEDDEEEPLDDPDDEADE